MSAGTPRTVETMETKVSRDVYRYTFDAKTSLSEVRDSLFLAVFSAEGLHGRSQVLLFPPADPAAQPTTNDPVAGQVVGLISSFPANFLQSSSYQVMDVTNVTGVARNDPVTLDHGLPAHLAWTWDPASGGAYASPQFQTNPPVQTDPGSGAPVPYDQRSLGPVANFQGAGRLDIKYRPDAHPRAGTLGSGVAVVRVQGLIYTTGAPYALSKPIN